MNSKDNSGIVITVASGKGGVGKTNLCLNLGIALSNLGSRSFLLDTDVGMANVDILLGMAPDYSLMNVVEERCSLEDALVKAPCQLDFIPAGSALDRIPELSWDEMQKMIQIFQGLRSYEMLIIDVGAGVSDPIMHWLGVASVPVVVVTPEPTSLTDAYSLIKLYRKQGHSSNVYIWVNQAKSVQHANRVFDRLNTVTEKYLGFSVRKMGCVPFDPKVQEAVARQRPFVLEYPDGPAAKNVNLVARVLRENSGRIRRGGDFQELFAKFYRLGRTPEEGRDQGSQAKGAAKPDSAPGSSAKLGETLLQEGMITEQGLEQGLQKQEEIRSKPLGEIFIEQGMVHPSEVTQALHRQKSQVHHKLGEILISVGALSREQLQEALSAQSQERSKRLGQVLVDLKLISGEQLALALALKFNLPYVDLAKYPVDPLATQYVSQDLAQGLQIFPFELQQHKLSVAFADPNNIESKQDIEFHTGLQIKEFIASNESIAYAIQEYYERRAPEEKLDEADIEDSDVEEIDTSDDEMDITETTGKEKSIVALANHIIKSAVNKRASDIHIQPEAKRVNVLYRIDGALHKEMGISKERLASLVTRLKIMSNMDIAERRMPQDGRSKIKVGDKVLDLRFSCMPSVYGESVVIRVLDKDAGLMKLESLGFLQDDVEQIKRCISRPYGMLLITGPTGSGKSSTIYSCLQEPTLLGKNIITLEDPVEYEMAGITQVQIREKIGFTFAKGLRQILRHDPDVISVGEIRDEETAKISIQAALTGHLLFSTLHTNTAAEVFIRLADMGVEPYLISASIIGAVSQRLIRRLCPNCQIEDEKAEEMLSTSGLAPETTNGFTFYKGKGCSRCNNTGYKGRTNVYEFLTVGERIKRGVLEGKNSAELKQIAVDGGMRPLEQVALQKAKDGVTSVEEILPMLMETAQ